jgi:hypothetical protein
MSAFEAELMALLKSKRSDQAKIDGLTGLVQDPARPREDRITGTKIVLGDLFTQLNATENTLNAVRASNQQKKDQLAAAAVSHDTHIDRFGLKPGFKDELHQQPVQTFCNGPGKNQVRLGAPKGQGSEVYYEDLDGIIVARPDDSHAPPADRFTAVLQRTFGPLIHNAALGYEVCFLRMGRVSCLSWPSRC